MRINACSVAFRHMNITAAALADYTLRHGFDGLEIWLPHARALAGGWAALPQRPPVPMLAGYLPLGEAAFAETGAVELCRLARHWQAGKLRLFAGNDGSASMAPTLRDRVTRDLRHVVHVAADHGLRIAVETHPGTLADTPGAALQLLQAVDHPALGLNFDVLHVWEAGCDPLAARALLAPHILHYHLKTVTSRACLPVFAPANIHDANGSRDGICPLFDGALDYAAILAGLPRVAEGSLEWFGPDPASTMAADLVRIRRNRDARAA
jgi:3-dehydroshikimate dehydratase